MAIRGSEDWKRNISISRKGKPASYGFQGHKHTEETKINMSLIRTGRKQTPEWITKRTSQHIGMKRSPETCENISKSKTGQVLNLSDAERERRRLWWTGSNSPRWNGGKKTEDKYIAIKSPNHPNKNNCGYVPEHRLVMEKYLGRFLNKQEVVHHLDHNPENNNIDNLHLFNNHSEHIKYEQMIQTEIRKELEV